MEMGQFGVEARRGCNRIFFSEDKIYDQLLLENFKFTKNQMICDAASLDHPKQDSHRKL
jgi:hypothetical protein